MVSRSRLMITCKLRARQPHQHPIEFHGIGTDIACQGRLARPIKNQGIGFIFNLFA